MIEREDQGGVAVLRMAHGKANAFDLELFQTLGSRLAEVTDDKTVRAVVLTGTGSMFSAGVDLFRVAKDGADYLERFLPALSQAVRDLVALPLPVVAAVNGHAIAGGGVLAAACDQVVMVEERAKIGFSELFVGVPFPAIALEVLRHRLGVARTQRLVLTGRLLTPAEAMALDLVDELAPAADVLERACALAAQLGAVPRAAFETTKRHLRSGLLAAVDGPLAAIDAAVVAQWSKPKTIERIGAFLEKTVGRKA